MERWAVSIISGWQRMTTRRQRPPAFPDSAISLDLVKSKPRYRRTAALLLVIPLMTAARGASAQLPAQSARTAARDYVQADIDFMQGMIFHHAQAVVMSDWADSHGARANLLVLCKRIALSQRDEINMMQQWLLEHHLSAPDPLHMLPGARDSVQDNSGMKMPGMDMGMHPMMMTGMLTPAEMRALDAARGAAFDSLYLTGMIRHHQGALDMVAKLFATPGAGQQPEISSFATDIDAGQRAEIARMQAMLNTLTPSQTR
jgi:uncharacterized protein (DUF305 family)